MRLIFLNPLHYLLSFGRSKFKFGYISSFLIGSVNLGALLCQQSIVRPLMRCEFRVYFRIHKIHFKGTTRCRIILIDNTICAESCPVSFVSDFFHLIAWLPSSQLAFAYPYCIVGENQSVEGIDLYWRCLIFCITLKLWDFAFDL